jgi:NADH:ubiquinone oxidoreductase subunit
LEVSLLLWNVDDDGFTKYTVSGLHTYELRANFVILYLADDEAIIIPSSRIIWLHIKNTEGGEDAE